MTRFYGPGCWKDFEQDFTTCLFCDLDIRESSFVKLGAGYHSDKIGHRKTWTVFGYFLTAVAKPLFAFALGWPLILIGRVIGWLGRGIRGPLRDAMLAESVASKDRGKAFGFHRAGDTAGAVLGPLGVYALLPDASE